MPRLRIREEATCHTLLYLTEKEDEHMFALDYQAALASLTEYTTCWYVDFFWQQAGRKPRSFSGELPGFTIEKKTTQIRLISWQASYELNCEPQLF